MIGPIKPLKISTRLGVTIFKIFVSDFVTLKQNNDLVVFNSGKAAPGTFPEVVTTEGAHTLCPAFTSSSGPSFSLRHLHATQQLS